MRTAGLAPLWKRLRPRRETLFLYIVVFVCSRIGGGAGERKSELKGLWKPDLTAQDTVSAVRGGQL